jgi:outer membrane receptor protein involved in Fe transport
VKGVRFRFTRSRDVRAPGLEELFSPQLFGLGTINDPQLSRSYQIKFLAGGNPHLKPEASYTTTIGATVSPAAIPNLNFSIDYFDINVKNGINIVDAQTTIDRCAAGNQVFCSAIVRGSDGLITTVTANSLNFLDVRSRGIDLNFAYTVPISLPGKVRITSNLTRMLRFDQNDGVSIVDYLGSQGVTYALGIPKLQANTSLFYDTERFHFMLRHRYISAGDYDKLESIQNNRIPQFNYFDLALGTTLDAEHDRKIDLMFNVNNLFDKSPPIASQVSPYYDVIGRYFSLSAKARF